jgi:ABC-type bacteriocin/lantibiotic exporter with double-glycine peptidase domain
MMRLIAFICFGLLCTACSPYMGHASTVQPDLVHQERGWIFVDNVPLVRQRAEHDCGPAALAMVVSYLRPELANDPFFTQAANTRVSVRELRDHARALGLSAFVLEGTPEDLVHELRSRRPVIAGVGKPTVQGPVFHYEVVVGFHPETRRVLMLDPAEGWLQNSFAGFIEEWQATGRVLLVVMPPGG